MNRKGFEVKAERKHNLFLHIVFMIKFYFKFPFMVHSTRIKSNPLYAAAAHHVGQCVTSTMLLNHLIYTVQSIIRNKVQLLYQL